MFSVLFLFTNARTPVSRLQIPVVARFLHVHQTVAAALRNGTDAAAGLHVVVAGMSAVDQAACTAVPHHPITIVAAFRGFHLPVAAHRLVHPDARSERAAGRILQKSHIWP